MAITPRGSGGRKEPTMSVRIVLFLAVLFAVAGNTLPGQAQECAQTGVVASIVRDFERRNCWPEPFIFPDRQAVRDPIAIMVARGWERQNMLAEQYFEENRADLTEAGKLKIRWIVAEPPPHHRVIYVRRTVTPELTMARIQAVTAFATQAAQPEPCPPVLETTASQLGWPADRVDVLSRKFYAAIPEPKLPAANGSSGAGSGSGSSQ
jgi:hypothetical protein